MVDVDVRDRLRASTCPTAKRVTLSGIGHVCGSTTTKILRKKVFIGYLQVDYQRRFRSFELGVSMLVSRVGIALAGVVVGGQSSRRCQREIERERENGTRVSSKYVTRQSPIERR